MYIMQRRNVHYNVHLMYNSRVRRNVHEMFMYLCILSRTYTDNIILITCTAVFICNQSTYTALIMLVIFRIDRCCCIFMFGITIQVTA